MFCSSLYIVVDYVRCEFKKVCLNALSKTFIKRFRCRGLYLRAVLSKFMLYLCIEDEKADIKEYNNQRYVELWI